MFKSILKNKKTIHDTIYKKETYQDVFKRFNLLKKYQAIFLICIDFKVEIRV